MNPHPRIHKAVKWSVAFTASLFFSAWVASFFWYARCDSPAGNSWRLDQGAFVVQRLGKPDGFWIPDFAWRFRVAPHPSGYRGVKVILAPEAEHYPLWPLILTSALFSLLAFRLDSRARRRAHLNLCEHCHYDRIGLPPNAPCPECGTLPAQNP